MTLVKLNPRNSWLDWNNEVDRMFHNMFDRNVSLDHSTSSINPVIDVQETTDEFKIYAELPGMKKDEIKITFHDNLLTISGEKKAENKSNDNGMYHVERRFGKFSRSIGINSGVVLDKISADYRDGVLTVSVPKAEEAKPKEIEVKVK